MEHQTNHDLHPVGPEVELESSDDTEVAAPAAKPSKEILVLVRAGGQELTGGRDEVNPDKPLHGEDSYAAIVDTGTDAIIIGGTTNVTETRVQQIVTALAPVGVPPFIESTTNPPRTTAKDSLDT